jgi:hypothetical protein
MVSEKIRHHQLKIASSNENSNAQIIILFSLQLTVITINDKSYDLKPYDLLVIENPKKENIVLHFSNECLFGILDF